MVFWSPDPESTSGPDLERHASTRTMRRVSRGPSGNSSGFAAPNRPTSPVFVSGRDAEHGESSEYGSSSLLDADFDELRSEVALLVAAAKQFEPLISARPQRRNCRLRLIVTAHHREVQKIPNRPPEFVPLLDGCTQARHKLPGCQLAFRVPGEHPEAHCRRGPADLSHQFQQRFSLLHRFAARESNPFQRLQPACFLKSLSHFEHSHFKATELVGGRVPAFFAMQRASLEIDHRAQSRSISPARGNESMKNHTTPPSFRRLRGYSAATALYAVSPQACRTCALFLVTRQSRSLSALEILRARVDGRAIERGFLSLHFRVIVSLEVLQGLVAALACKALQIHCTVAVLVNDQI